MKRTIEVQIYVRCRDEAHNPIGKVGSFHILFHDIEGCWGAKGRQIVADAIGVQARDIVEKQAPTGSDR